MVSAGAPGGGEAVWEGEGAPGGGEGTRGEVAGQGPHGALNQSAHSLAKSHAEDVHLVADLSKV